MKNSLIILISSVLLVVVVYFTYSWSFDSGYLFAKQEIRKKLEKEGIIAPLPKSIVYIMGKVFEVDLSARTVNVSLHLVYDPLFNIGENTEKRYRAVASVVDGAEIVKRFSTEDPETRLIPQDQVISLADLKPGDQVGLLSTENIVGKKSFQVSKIVLLD